MGCGSSSEAGANPPHSRPEQRALSRKAQMALKTESESRESRLAAYDAVKDRLPSDVSQESVDVRKSLFRQWDVNGNGKLSLAEIDKACREQLELENVTANLEPILIRAYYATLGDHDDDGLIEIVQFRRLLEYIALFFEMMFVFEVLGGHDDRRISKKEFMENVTIIRPYLVDRSGATLGDPEAVFETMDANHGGFVLFEELCDFIAQNRIRVSTE